MNRAPLTFLLAGLTAGVVTVAIGSVWQMVLVNGVGLLFYAALLAAITITASWSRMRRGLWRYAMGMVISSVAYLAGLFAFSIAGAYSPALLGMAASSSISNFGADMAVGLISAALVSSVCIELVAFLLTGCWSTRYLVFLILSGVSTVGATYLAHLFVRGPWGFFGILLPVGEALFCWIIGLQIWQSVRGPVHLDWTSKK